MHVKASEMRSLLDKGMNPKVEVRVQQQNTSMQAHLKMSLMIGMKVIV